MKDHEEGFATETGTGWKHQGTKGTKVFELVDAEERERAFEISDFRGEVRLPEFPPGFFGFWG